MLATHIPLRPDWGHRYWDPLYAEAERLDVGLAFHHKSVHGELTDQRFNNFITVHTIGHPVEQMMSLTSVIVGGVVERFPTAAPRLPGGRRRLGALLDGPPGRRGREARRRRGALT